MAELTPQQKQDLVYFWLEKQDLERFCDFEKLKPQIKKELPCLYKAWKDYKEVVERLNILSQNIIDNL